MNLRDIKEWAKAWAGVFTIIGVFIALWIFIFNYCYQQNKEKEEYITQLEALEQELKINHEHMTQTILNSEEGFLRGKHVPRSRYFVYVINKLITEGKIKNYTLRHVLYYNAHVEGLANQALETANFLFITAPLLTEEANIDVHDKAVIDIMESLIKNAKTLNETINDTIRLIKKEAKKVEDEKDSSFCTPYLSMCNLKLLIPLLIITTIIFFVYKGYKNNREGNLDNNK